MSYLRSGPRLVENDSFLQSVGNAAGKYGFMAENSYVCMRSVSNVVFGCVVFQNLSVSAGVRLFRKGGFVQV